jgi:hypothetical protein
LDEEGLLQQGGILARWLEKLREQAEQAADERERTIAQMARREALRLLGGLLR